MKKIKTFLFLAMIIIASSTIAQSPSPSIQTDRDLLIQNSTEIKGLHNEIIGLHNEIIGLRNEMVARFEAEDKRFELEDKRFEQMLTFMGWFIGAFVTITLGAILNAWWDRRSTLRPLEGRTKSVELEIEEIKKETSLGKVIAAFRDLAKDNPKVAEILKNNHLL